MKRAILVTLTAAFLIAAAQSVMSAPAQGGTRVDMYFRCTATFEGGRNIEIGECEIMSLVPHPTPRPTPRPIPTRIARDD